MIRFQQIFALEYPIGVPSPSLTKIPLDSSFCLIIGILMQLAAATAANGINRPINGGAL